MKIEYVSVSPEKVLDVLVLDDDTCEVLTATTGKGRPTVEMAVRRYGAIGARKVLASWSNGYVSMREINEEVSP